LPHPASARGTRRSPVGSSVPVQKSERTSPHEGSHIRSTGSRRKASRKVPRKGKRKKGAKSMDGHTDDWRQRKTFVGFDWASDHHDVVVVDSLGKIIEDFRFDDTGEGWQRLAKTMSKHPDPAVVIETSGGMTVQRLLESGYAVYPVNPKAAKRYRERKAPSGTKTDRLDAWSLADALRLDGHTWRQLKADDPLIAELRLLCRDEVALIEQRTAFICQLRAALHEYYPVVLEAFEDWTRPSAWAFVEAFPTPEALTKAGKRKWEKPWPGSSVCSKATWTSSASRSRSCSPSTRTTTCSDPCPAPGRNSPLVCWQNWATIATVSIHPRHCNATPARRR